MEKNKKKKYLIMGIISIGIILAIIAGVIISMNNKNLEQEENINNNSINLNDMEMTENVEVKGDTKINTSEKLLAERTFETLKMKNISLVSVNGTTTFKATLENETNNIYEAKEVEIILKDKDGKELGKIGGLIEKIQPKESGIIDASISIDLSNAYDFDFLSAI